MSTKWYRIWTHNLDSRKGQGITNMLERFTTMLSPLLTVVICLFNRPRNQRKEKKREIKSKKIDKKKRKYMSSSILWYFVLNSIFSAFSFLLHKVCSITIAISCLTDVCLMYNMTWIHVGFFLLYDL